MGFINKWILKLINIYYDYITYVYILMKVKYNKINLIYNYLLKFIYLILFFLQKK